MDESQYLKCPICFKNYNKEKTLVTLNCGHDFCNTCLNNIHFLTNSSCSICRKDISFGNSNCNYLLELYYSWNIKNQSETIFCLKCSEIVFNKESHSVFYSTHNSLNYEELLSKIVSNKSKVNQLKNVKSHEYLENIYSRMNFQQINSKIKKYPVDFLKNDLDYNSKLDYYENLRKFTLISKLLRKPVTDKFSNKNFKSLVGMRGLFIKKNIENQRKSVISYIKNSTKFVLYNLDELESEIVDIIDLPFHFYKNSHSIELDHNTNKVYIIGGKQDNLLYSNMSKSCWVYNLTTKKLNSLREFPVPISFHKSICINHTIYVIGGMNRDTYYNQIYKSETMNDSLFNLKPFKTLCVPRSKFGISVVDNQLIYVFSGETTDSIIINSIERIDIYSDSKVSHFYSIKEPIYNLSLINLGVVYNEKNFILLGGEPNQELKNKQIITISQENLKAIEAIEKKSIPEGEFLSYGVKFNNIIGILSCSRLLDNDPHIYLYSCAKKEWSCLEISI